jgi:hypothetical protein
MTTFLVVAAFVGLVLLVGLFIWARQQDAPENWRH